MGTYKAYALVGMIIMGVSSFTACLAKSGTLITLGNAGLIASIIIMSYAFSKWQP